MVRNIVTELLELVTRELKIDPASVGPTGVGPDTRLFEGGLELDSFAVVDLVTRIETYFGVQLSDTDFQPENFTDFQTLGSVVQRYVHAAGAKT